jgi:hypothetical protein
LFASSGTTLVWRLSSPMANAVCRLLGPRPWYTSTGRVPSGGQFPAPAGALVLSSMVDLAAASFFFFKL